MAKTKKHIDRCQKKVAFLACDLVSRIPFLPQFCIVCQIKIPNEIPFFFNFSRCGGCLLSSRAARSSWPELIGVGGPENHI